MRHTSLSCTFLRDAAMPQMERFTDQAGHLWGVLSGPSYIDGTAGQHLLDTSLQLLEQGYTRIVLNLEGTRVVNSIGISRFILMIETFDRHNGAVAFCGINQTIAKTFRMMGLLQKVALFGSLQDAIERLPVRKGV